jgi:hypothetical protein
MRPRDFILIKLRLGVQNQRKPLFFAPKAEILSKSFHSNNLSTVRDGRKLSKDYQDKIGVKEYTGDVISGLQRSAKVVFLHN